MADQETITLIVSTPPARIRAMSRFPIAVCGTIPKNPRGSAWAAAGAKTKKVKQRTRR
jgi:hypothetical protein